MIDVLSAARAGSGRWNLDAAHFAERHGLIVIIALGESLIAAGVALGEVTRDLLFTVGSIAAVVAVCALWWIYFGSAKDALERHLESQPPEKMGHEARNVYSWGHLPIIAGIIGFAVAIEQVLTHLDEGIGAEALAALTVAIALYLGGISYGIHRAGAGPIGPWVAVMVLAAGGGGLASTAASGVASLVVVGLVLVGFAFWGYSRQTRKTVSTS